MFVLLNKFSLMIVINGIKRKKFLQFSSFYIPYKLIFRQTGVQKNKMTKQLQQSFHASQSIASLALEQSIIHKTLLHCMPKQYVYEDSCRKAQMIENSVINIYSSQPDCEANNIRDIKDFKRNPTSFKVKQLKRQPSLIKQRTKPRRYKPSILRSNSIKYSNTEADAKQKQIVSQLKSHGTVSYHQSSQPFYPFDHRIRDRSKLVRLTTNESQKQNNMQLIKIFRQNLFIKPHYFQDFDMQKSELSDSSVSTKKIKDLNKKIFALNTDYSGTWVQINRNDIKKQVSHFIQMETEVIEEPKEQEIPKKQQIRITSNSDYTNYKELKIVENQNNFATNILKKIKVKGQDKNQPEIGSSSAMKNMELYINSGKMIGRKAKPAKVGFHVFEQMKNSCNLTELQKSQQNMKKQQFRVKTSGSHHDDIASRQKLSQQSKDTGLRLSKKCVEKTPNIIVKNSSALNYLLSENTRGYKKKVTIVQNCI